MDIVKKWHFEANIAKCAVVVFRNEKELDGTWTWGDSVFMERHTLIIIILI